MENLIFESTPATHIGFVLYRDAIHLILQQTLSSTELAWESVGDGEQNGRFGAIDRIVISLLTLVLLIKTIVVFTLFY